MDLHILTVDGDGQLAHIPIGHIHFSKNRAFAYRHSLGALFFCDGNILASCLTNTFLPIVVGFEIDLVLSTSGLYVFLVEELVDHNLKHKNTIYVGFPIPFTNLNDKYGNGVYYGDNYDKLKKIRDKVDPLGILNSTGTL